MFKRPDGLTGGNTCCNGKPGGNQSVGQLKVPRKRYVDLVDRAFMMNFRTLPVALVFHPLECKKGPSETDSQHVQPGICRNRNHLIRPHVIGENDGWCSAWQQAVEQSHLGGKIVIYPGVVIEMIAAKIGKCARSQTNAVKPVLMQAVTGRLNGAMGHTLTGKLTQ